MMSGMNNPAGPSGQTMMGGMPDMSEVSNPALSPNAALIDGAKT